MTDLNKGLTNEEVAQRISDGRVNGSSDIKTKSVGQIIKDNTLTFFNFLNIILAALVLIFGGGIKNAMFIAIILCNTGIGIFQEIRAKRTIDRLTLISAPKAHVIRAGEELEIPTSQIVADDVVIFRAGMQAAADCEVLCGECEVNESLITGESDPVYKKQGEMILSGSIIVSGEAHAQAVKIGSESFASKITSGAKYLKKTDSKMMNSINTILKVISIVIIPLMALQIINGVFWATPAQEFDHAVVSSVGAIIMLIPEGLVLLTSIALAVSSIRLALNKTLVQDMYCIETLARVDVLCLDKTGTITEGSMKVEEVLPLSDEDSGKIDELMTALACALSDGNPTFNAVKEHWSGESGSKAEHTLPFSSAKKWSGAYFSDHKSIIMGAGQFILGRDYDEIKDKVDAFSKGGRRVILLARSDLPFNGRDLPAAVRPVALIAISDKIRQEAPQTLEYFDKQGVDIKIISGDDPHTVSAVAKKAGVKNADRFLDCAGVENIGELVDQYTVFGRVTPAQKLELVKALKAAGHTVGMTGDGVNDVLALKEADCSIAMQSGSDAARNVSNLVLLDSNFASMPKVVGEGRRSINNVERSASLFLSKTVYSILNAIIFVILQRAFPFEPIQATLINALCIGIPSFLLALQPNTDIIRGGFIVNVMKKAIPNGITATTSLLTCIYVCHWLGLDAVQTSTCAACVLACVSFMVVLLSCEPMRAWKIGMLAGLIGAFFLGMLVFREFFNYAPFTQDMVICVACICLGAIVCILLLNLLSRLIMKKLSELKKKRQQAKAHA